MQIAQTFGPGVGVRAALKATGAAIFSFVANPLNLAVLGIASSSAAVPLLWSAVTSGSRDANEALERNKELIEEIAEAYPRAAKAAEDYGQRSAKTLLVEAYGGIGDLQQQFDRQLTGLQFRLGRLLEL